MDRNFLEKSLFSQLFIFIFGSVVLSTRENRFYVICVLNQGQTALELIFELKIFTVDFILILLFIENYL